MQLDDFTTRGRALSRPKRRVEEALGDERNSDLIQQQQQQPSMYAQPVASSSSAYVPMEPTPVSYGLPYTTAMQAAAPTMHYVPGSEWWPQLIGPGAGQSAQQASFDYPAATMGTTQLSGLPQSLFTFDQEQLSSDFMQGVPPGDPNMPAHYSQGQQPPHPPHPPPR